jgi:hypothetical protein
MPWNDDSPALVLESVRKMFRRMLSTLPVKRVMDGRFTSYTNFFILFRISTLAFMKIDLFILVKYKQVQYNGGDQRLLLNNLANIYKFLSVCRNVNAVWTSTICLLMQTMNNQLVPTSVISTLMFLKISRQPPS